jgi:hypothetical protein
MFAAILVTMVTIAQRKQSVLNVERVATLLGFVQTNNTSLAEARDVVCFVVDSAMIHLLALVTTILMT